MGETNTNMSLANWLDDLTVRFLLNLPHSELSSVPRLCFQVEEAQWFYEDFIRPAAAATSQPLPSLPLKQFCLQLFQHTPLLRGYTSAEHLAAYEEFLAYKVRVPVRGAILMDESMEKVLLVKGWKKSASWSFPRGKINKDEADLDCAVREVYEETGYDIRGAGLIPRNSDAKGEVKSIEITLREQQLRMFVFRGVDLETHFEPQTRKEISKIEWYNLRDLPGFKKGKYQESATKFYVVAPFLGQLKKWVGEQKRLDAQKEAQVAAPGHPLAHANVELEEETDGQAEEPLQQIPTPAVPVDKTEELKKLLNLAGPSPRAPQPAPAPASAPNDLLALLRGGAPAQRNVPQTPLDQIQQFPPQPTSPRPHHPRQPMAQQQQPVPQFPFSPQTLHHHPQPQAQAPQQRSVTTPAIFGGPNQGFPQIPPQQQALLDALRGPQPRLPQSGPVTGMPPMSQQRPQSQLPPHLQYQPQAPQGPQGAIAAGPSIPKAANLPMPNMNAHSMNLLNAFKISSGKQAASSSGLAGAEKARQPSQHQSALLDLFRKPAPAASGPPAATSAPAQGPAVASPASPEAVPPVEVPRRKSSTLNEITRTLPTSFKKKAPPPAPGPQEFPPLQQPSRNASQPAISSAAPAPIAARALPQQQQQDLERPKSRGQLFDPKLASAAKGIQRPDSATLPLPHQPPIASQPQGQRTIRAARGSKHASPSRNVSKARSNENGHPQPAPPIPQPQLAFKILARPQSRAADTTIPSSIPSPESVDPATVQKVAKVVEEERRAEAGNAQVDKRDQLLSLFGGKAEKTSMPVSAVVPKSPPVPPAGAPKTNLLDLFAKGQPASVPSSSQVPLMPAAGAPTSPPVLAGGDKKSNLLDLFSKGPSQQPAAENKSTLR